MKFQFCGGVPCPEWFLAESSILAKITAIKLKLITANLILFLLEGANITEKVSKLLEGTAFTTSEINALVSTLEFIIRNAATFHIGDSVLHKELVDMGLPKENVESIVKSYKQSADKLRQHLTSKFSRVGSQGKISASVSQLVSGVGTESLVTFAEVTLEFRNSQEEKEKVCFMATSDMVEELVFSLERAKKAMRQAESGS